VGMWRNEKACARKKNSDSKKYLGLTGNKTTRMLPELSEREKLLLVKKRQKVSM